MDCFECEAPAPYHRAGCVAVTPTDVVVSAPSYVFAFYLVLAVILAIAGADTDTGWWSSLLWVGSILSLLLGGVCSVPSRR